MPACCTLTKRCCGRSCVPYKGNEEWTEGLATAGSVKLKKEWHPWFTAQVRAKR